MMSTTQIHCSWTKLTWFLICVGTTQIREYDLTPRTGVYIGRMSRGAAHLACSGRVAVIEDEISINGLFDNVLVIIIVHLLINALKLKFRMAHCVRRLTDRLPSSGSNKP